MGITGKPECDRVSELKSFDNTKAGVKGLVDAGLTKIPPLFHHPPHKSDEPSNLGNTQHIIPVIDLADIDQDPIIRQEIVEKLRDASETWGFFQLLNHGIPASVLEEIKHGVCRFHEEDMEIKREMYTRDYTKPFLYNSNFDLYTSPALNWRDTFMCHLAPNTPNPQDLPEACRDILVEYGEHIMKLGILLFELLSEALGLNPNHLKDMGCADGLLALGHYYPACPEPDLTMGASKQSDNDFLTVLLQDHNGGLQALYQDKWIHIPPVPGALVLITNDKFKSVEHRVLANIDGPKISVASLFNSGLESFSKPYGPINELLSEHNPPKYRTTTFAEYIHYHNTKCLDGNSALLHFRI
ncbi:1-aminocyclopropane-1-carboxylate oxidase-like protein 1-like [Senna tora]|uniref:1-aminocyclopropane-1-carboxylate oxidase-like protein 1-like n=1 Tax=Senna tora TaxID=362788 RepID=A0A834X3S1_9FABA|nr:1-aminocyclopropane-1-carboxylate oxidase-like protein 1-like [Senna tora]